MDIEKPDIIDSEWVYPKPWGGYALKPGAPDDVKAEFKEFQKAIKESP